MYITSSYAPVVKTQKSLTPVSTVTVGPLPAGGGSRFLVRRSAHVSSLFQSQSGRLFDPNPLSPHLRINSCLSSAVAAGGRAGEWRRGRRFYTHIFPEREKSSSSSFSRRLRLLLRGLETGASHGAERSRKRGEWAGRRDRDFKSAAALLKPNSFLLK